MGENRRSKPWEAVLPELLTAAVAGDERPLYDKLTRGSWLPGAQANLELAALFGTVAAALGPKVDRFVETMARLDADAAPGGTELEFLPMCGVAAVGARAAVGDRHAPKLLGVLHDAAEDLRWRVRAMVSSSLAGIGAVRGVSLFASLDEWMAGYFHAAAVLVALEDPRWLTSIKEADAAEVASFLDQAFQLVRSASRSASRYPGFKALVEVLPKVAPVVAFRFGAPVFDVFEQWAEEKKDPALREIVEKILSSSKLKARHTDEVAHARRTLSESAPPRRDPRTYVGKTRGRGRKHSAR